MELLSCRGGMGAVGRGVRSESLSSGTRGTLLVRYRATVGFCFSFVGLGLLPGVYGPSLAALAQSSGLRGEASLAPSFMVRGVCYGMGTLLGGLAANRLSPRSLLLWTAASLAMSGCGLALPFARSLPAVLALVGGLNLAGGAVDVLGNILIVDLWEDDDRRGALCMNLLHASWSVGATIAPSLAAFIGLEPATLPRVYATVSVLNAVTGLAPLLLGHTASTRRAAPAPLAAADEAREARPADSRGANPNRPKQTVGEMVKPRKPATSSASPASCGHFTLVIGSMLVFYVCLGSAERVPGDWLTSVVARSSLVGASEEAGAFCTSIFFGAHLVGRLISVPLSWFLSTNHMLSGTFTIACVSAVAMLTLGQRYYSWLCVSFAGVGLGISALYPYGILLAKDRVPLSAVWLSRLAAAALLGDVALPPLVGALLSTAPGVLYWAEASAVFLQTACYLLVACLPSATATPQGSPKAVGPVGATTLPSINDEVIVVHLRDLHGPSSPSVFIMSNDKPSFESVGMLDRLPGNE